MNLSITPKDLLDAGVHFGHQTRRWNPRSKPYVFDHRQGITIIDLGKTYELLQKACDLIEDTVGNGGTVLFVGTKRQAQDIIKDAATATNMPYCVDRWLGGTLTNFATVKRSISKFKKFQQMETSGELAKLGGKESASIKREMARMQRNFSGIVEMSGLPSIMFVVDQSHEKIAVSEAARCAIPCVGLVDTNSDPTAMSNPIPGNDDAVKSIRIIVDTITAAVQSGLSLRESRRAAHGQADIRAANAGAADADAAAATAAAETGEVDLSKVALPSGVSAEIDSESEAEKPAAKKNSAKRKAAAPKPAQEPA